MGGRDDGVTEGGVERVDGMTEGGVERRVDGVMEGHKGWME